MAEIPQVALPLRLGADGQPFTIEQGSTLDLASRVNVLCRTPPGWLDGSPGFGLADQRFRRGGADMDEITNQISTWVPDADALVEEDPSMLDDGLHYIGVKVTG